MGRPAKYHDAAARKEARRLQTRRHVREHRERRAAQKASGDDPTPDTTVRDDKVRLAECSRDTKLLGLQADVVDEALHGQGLRRANKAQGYQWWTLMPLQKPTSTAHDSCARSKQPEQGLGLRRADKAQSDESSTLIPSRRPISTVYDFCAHSSLPEIRLSFGTREAIMRDCQRVLCVPFHASLQQLYRESRLIEIAAFAAGSRCVGHLLTGVATEASNWFTRMSYLAYQETAQQLRQILAATTTYTIRAVEHILTTLQCLVYFDGINGGAEEATWMVHAIAQRKVFTSAGPAVFANATGLHLLRLYRPLFVMNAALNRKKCLLDSAEWRQLPDTVGDFTLEDELYNVFAGVPGLMETSNVLSAVGAVSADDLESPSTAEQIQMLTTTLRDCYTVMSQLQDLERRLPQTCDEFANNVSICIHVSTQKTRSVCLTLLLQLGTIIRSLRRSYLYALAVVPGTVSTEELTVPDDTLLDGFADQILAVILSSIARELVTGTTFFMWCETQLQLLRQWYSKGSNAYHLAQLQRVEQSLERVIRHRNQVVDKSHNRLDAFYCCMIPSLSPCIVGRMWRIDRDT